MRDRLSDGEEERDDDDDDEGERRRGKVLTDDVSAHSFSLVSPLSSDRHTNT